MFDAHFQLIASASEEDEGEAAGADNNEEPETSAAAAGGESAVPAPAAWGPETDLVKGVYEGGMKTWECAGDLVGVLQAEVVQDASWKAVEGKRIMEVRCRSDTSDLISQLTASSRVSGRSAAEQRSRACTSYRSC
jgi:protein-histidine N-methyltransferase